MAAPETAFDCSALSLFLSLFLLTRSLLLALSFTMRLLPLYLSFLLALFLFLVALSVLRTVSAKWIS
jgi:hypothetical protein